MVETELSLSSGKKGSSGVKDINDNEAFEPQIVVKRKMEREEERGKAEKVPLCSQLMEMVAGKSPVLPLEAAGPEEKLSCGKKLAESKDEVEMKRGSLDERDNRLLKPNRDLSDEKPAARVANGVEVVEEENMKVEDEKLRVGEESSDCLSSSSRRALKRTAQITPPPGKDATKVKRTAANPAAHIFPPF